MAIISYRNTSFYTMRTDSRDRFGTPLEQRFTRSEIKDMMLAAGLDDIKFSNRSFWVAVGKNHYRNNETCNPNYMATLLQAQDSVLTTTVLI